MAHEICHTLHLFFPDIHDVHVLLESRRVVIDVSDDDLDSQLQGEGLITSSCLQPQLQIKNMAGENETRFHTFAPHEGPKQTRSLQALKSRQHSSDDVLTI